MFHLFSSRCSIFRRHLEKGNTALDRCVLLLRESDARSICAELRQEQTMRGLQDRTSSVGT